MNDILTHENRIRIFAKNDMDAVLDIWLTASKKAHDFIEPSFWESQVDNMRTLYIPASETCVVEQEASVVGFYALHKNKLEALFVSPEFQGRGIGTQLLAHAKTKRDGLTLSVYKENEASCRFYRTHGFAVVSEQADEHTGHLEYTMRSNL